MKKHEHYCKVCGKPKPNEQFTGRGHAAHICKSCAKLSPAAQTEAVTIVRLESLPWWLSETQIAWLKNRCKDKRPAVKALAREEFSIRFPHSNVKKVQK
jgi:hypothetical protein